MKRWNRVFWGCGGIKNNISGISPTYNLNKTVFFTLKFEAKINVLIWLENEKQIACWRISVETVNLRHWWWENKLAQATWKAICNRCDLVIRLLQIWPEETFLQAHAVIAHSKKAGKTSMSTMKNYLLT